MYSQDMALVAEYPELIPGALIGIRSGVWTPARLDLGIIIAVEICKAPLGDAFGDALVYMPKHPERKLSWHKIDYWHLQTFWEFF